MKNATLTTENPKRITSAELDILLEFSKRIKYRLFGRISTIYLDDVVSDIQECILLKYHTFDPSKVKSFLRFCYIVANCEIIDHYRRKKGNGQISETQYASLLTTFEDSDTEERFPTIEPNTMEVLINAEKSKELISKIDLIKNKTLRQVIKLFYIEEYSQKEIAEIMHIPVTQVGVYNQRGMVQLKKVFKVA